MKDSEKDINIISSMSTENNSMRRQLGKDSVPSNEGVTYLLAWKIFKFVIKLVHKNGTVVLHELLRGDLAKSVLV